MAHWIVRTKGEYPHLLPHLVEEVVSKKWVGEDEMLWEVEMTEMEAEAVAQRAFAQSVEPAHASGRLQR
ncbi:MAG TPA: hypothetical protein VHS06_10580 [Chloroflexota bacterium]|nr:hypothetical protein [Chloroflexota bacterium]